MCISNACEHRWLEQRTTKPGDTSPGSQMTRPVFDCMQQLHLGMDTAELTTVSHHQHPVWRWPMTGVERRISKSFPEEAGLAEGQGAQANCILPCKTMVTKCNCVLVWFQQPARMSFSSSCVKFCVAWAFARMTLIASHVLSAGYSLDQDNPVWS